MNKKNLAARTQEDTDDRGLGGWVDDRRVSEERFGASYEKGIV